MKWCSGSTAAQSMLTESGCRNNASINWGLYELRLQKTHLSHISETALLFRKLRSWLCVSISLPCRPQSRMVMIAVNIQQLTDQYIEWQWTIKPPLKMAANYCPSKQFLSVYAFWDVPCRSCNPTSHHLSGFSEKFWVESSCLPYSQGGETLFPLWF